MRKTWSHKKFKSAVKEMVMNKLSVMVEDLLDDILRAPFHNAQALIQSGIYNVFEQMRVDLLPKEVVEETLNAHIAKLVDNDAAANEFLKRWLASCSLLVLTATFVRREKKHQRRNGSTIPPFASKEQINIVQTHNNDWRSQPSCSDSRNEDMSGTKWSNCCLKRKH